MTFFRAVEVFPPIIGPDDGDGPTLRKRVEEFISSVKSIRSSCDVVLVADVKNPAVLKFSTVEAAALLQAQAGVNAAPVIVVRDSNRPRTLSAIFTAYGLGLRSVMLVWGDRYPASARAKNVYDFRDLAAVISEARAIARRSAVDAKILAPVNLESLRKAGGVHTANSRLEAGADLLLAQPPTTDTSATLVSHRALLESAGLKDRVLPGVFPFRSRKDVSEYSLQFGWRLPRFLYEEADNGEEALIAEAREVVKRLRKDGFSGVYVATRGSPAIARAILGPD